MTGTSAPGSSNMHDLVIRGGTVVDGSLRPARTADVAIDGTIVTEVGDVDARGRRELDADGQIVTPGFVDIHTHYDGQATWDPYLTPSGWHGVTTVVMGNCGVGFAPAAPDRHEWLIGLMEGVEDIPGAALTEGMTWEWESFPEYLDALDRMPRALDIAAQVPHGAVRAYVMGERGAKNEAATPDDIEAMAEIVREAIAAGAVGFTTSRTMLHRAKDGELVPGTFASDDELLGIGAVMGELDAGVFEFTSDMVAVADEMSWMQRFSQATGRPVTFSCLQNDFQPEAWRDLLERSERATAEGARIVPQVAGRPTCLLFGLESSAHPFVLHDAYQPLAALPLAERVARMRDPEVRAAILSEDTAKLGFANAILSRYDKLFPLGDPPDYEPPPEASVAAIAAREGRSAEEVAYDLLLQSDGKELLYSPFLGYSYGDFEVMREMLEHPLAVLGLGDGGAHCGVLCDASLPTYMLSHWVRDRDRGERLPLEFAVNMQTRRTAEMYGFMDRGLLAPGMKADVNVLDLDGLKLRPPEVVFDLPAHGRRMIQKADGYRATIVAGECVYENGEPTGALPGSLLRGATVAANGD